MALAVDDDPTIIKTLEMIARQYPGDDMTFANGGDRSTTAVVPEAAICERHDIDMVFGIGGTEKADSSSRITHDRGHSGDGGYGLFTPSTAPYGHLSSRQARKPEA